MPEREMVIRGLELCAYDPDPGQELKKVRSCPKCPYYRAGCAPHLIRDALALLKEQEPRVLTKEEITRYPDVWLEELTDPQFPPCPVSNGRLDPDEESDIRFEFPCCEHGYYPLSQYGKTWRCWTSRPSPDQMRETPWEEDNNA